MRKNKVEAMSQNALRVLKVLWIISMSMFVQGDNASF